MEILYLNEMPFDTDTLIEMNTLYTVKSLKGTDYS